MDESSVLAHLRELTASFDGDGPPLTQAFAALTTAINGAVTSFVGLTVTAYRYGYPVVVTAMTDARSASTSLRLTVPTGTDGAASTVETVIYASRPGALVDLAADLGYALANNDRIAVDADLPPDDQDNGITGLDELSAIERAIGVLLDRGHHPDEVHTTIQRHASAAGVEPHVWARQLLET